MPERRHTVRNNKKELREKIRKMKTKCCHCGEDHVACLEFHHRDENEKELEICKMLSRYTEEEIMEEIKKCNVVCCNCHRKIHYKEKAGKIKQIGESGEVSRNNKRLAS